MKDVIIVGGGVSGLTAAMYTSRALLETVVVEETLSAGGQIALTANVDNYPGFPEGISGVELSNRLVAQAEKFGSKLRLGEKVHSISPIHGGFSVTLDNDELETRAVILASGATPRRLGVPGEEEFLGRGVSTCATCDGFFFMGKNVTVVGGGDAAVEEAVFLTRFAESVNVIHRSSSLRANRSAQEDAYNNPKVSFTMLTKVTEILGSEGVVSGVRVETEDGEEVLPTDGVFIYIGHTPNVVPAGLETDITGHVKVVDDVYTNVPGLFSAGDVSDPIYRQLATSIGSGAKAGCAAEKWLQWEAQTSRS